MSPAATITQDAVARVPPPASLDRRQTAWVVCGSIVPLDRSLVGGASQIVCVDGYFCAVSSTYEDCVPTTGGTIRTTCLDKSATCVGFACPSNAIFCTIYSTYCQTWVYASSYTGYGCGTVPVSINVDPRNLTPYTPNATSTSSTGASIISSSPSITSPPTQTTATTVQLIGPNTSATPSPSTSSSLSAGARIGIGLGVSFGALLIAAIILIVFRKELYARVKLLWHKPPKPSYTDHKNAAGNNAPYELEHPREIPHELPVQQMFR